MDELNRIREEVLDIFEDLNGFDECMKLPCTYTDTVQVFAGTPDNCQIIEIEPNRYQLGGYLEFDARYHTAQLTEVVATFIEGKEQERLKHSLDGLHLVESEPIVKVCYNPDAGGDIWVGLEQCFGFGSFGSE